MSKGVLEFTKQKQEHERKSEAEKALPAWHRSYEKRQCQAHDRKPRSHLHENDSLSPKGKGFSSPQFLLETKLELRIKARSVSILPGSLRQLRLTHPLQVSSSITSSRKFSLTLPPGSGLLFYVYNTLSSFAAFLIVVVSYLST